MAHHDDARFDDLVAQLGDGDSKDLFRRLLERGMQQLIDAELTATIGAELHERTDTRTNQRNGARERTLSTPAGDIDLRIPKLRVGSFFPRLLEPRRRVDRALWAVIMIAYVTGPRLAKSTIWSGRWAINRGSASRRSAGSARASTTKSPCSAPDHSGPSRCRMCISTQPRSRPATTIASCRAPLSW